MEEMNKNNQINNEYCVFFDVLGTKNKFDLISNDKTLSEVEKENKEIQLLDNFESLIKEIKAYIREWKNDINDDIIDSKVKFFSDNIFFSFPKEDFGKIYYLISLIAKIQIFSIMKCDLCIRGGMDYGKVRNNNSVLMGEGLIKAVKLEELAEFPIVRITNETYTSIVDTRSYAKELLESDQKRLNLEDIDIDWSEHLDGFNNYNENFVFNIWDDIYIINYLFHSLQPSKEYTEYAKKILIKNNDDQINYALDLREILISHKIFIEKNMKELIGENKEIIQIKNYFYNYFMEKCCSSYILKTMKKGEIENSKLDKLKNCLIYFKKNIYISKEKYDGTCKDFEEALKKNHVLKKYIFLAFYHDIFISFNKEKILSELSLLKDYNKKDKKDIYKEITISL